MAQTLGAGHLADRVAADAAEVVVEFPVEEEIQEVVVEEDLIDSHFRLRKYGFWYS